MTDSAGADQPGYEPRLQSRALMACGALGIVLIVISLVVGYCAETSVDIGLPGGPRLPSMPALPSGIAAPSPPPGLPSSPGFPSGAAQPGTAQPLDGPRYLGGARWCSKINTTPLARLGKVVKRLQHNYIGASETSGCIIDLESKIRGAYAGSTTVDIETWLYSTSAQARHQFALRRYANRQTAINCAGVERVGTEWSCTSFIGADYTILARDVNLLVVVKISTASVGTPFFASPARQRHHYTATVGSNVFKAMRGD